MPTRHSNEPIDLAGSIIARTDDAVLFFDGACRSPARNGKAAHDGVWLPRSKIEIAYQGNAREPAEMPSALFPHACTVTIPEWLAYKEGLI